MTVGGKPTFFMIGGSMELDKNDIISTVSNYLIEENLELYDINIVNYPSVSKIEIYVYSSTNLEYKTIVREGFGLKKNLDPFSAQHIISIHNASTTGGVTERSIRYWRLSTLA